MQSMNQKGNQQPGQNSKKGRNNKQGGNRKENQNHDKNDDNGEGEVTQVEGQIPLEAFSEETISPTCAIELRMHQSLLHRA